MSRRSSSNPAPGGSSPSPVRPRWVLDAVAAVARHPSLWTTAVRQAAVLAEPGWWRRRPFLPLPAPDYLRFRLQAAYGGAGDREPLPEDLVTYLWWCRSFGGRRR
jgi:hypothetical protein